MNKTLLSVLFVFSLIGVFVLGVGVHEGYHILVSDEFVSFNFDFGKEVNGIPALVHVNVVDYDNDKFEEAKAFSLQMALSILFTIGITNIYMEKRNE